jgi:hypothetical protein
MKIYEKTITREHVAILRHSIMDLTDEGLVVRWRLLGVTIWKRKFTHPFSDPISSPNTKARDRREENSTEGKDV